VIAAIQEEHHVKTIRIAPDLDLPLDVVTQTLAMIARKGGGKTYLAQLIAELMLDAGAQIAALDIVGNWFGLRLAADGKRKGKDIVILGGEHGDVPLTPASGAHVARFLVEKRVSAVLDISTFRRGEQKRFAGEFADELFHAKKTQRSPMHLFLEEAQLVAPQRVQPDEARMLGAFELIVRLGRNYGIGCSLITQRPQSVNKEVLTQVECLCVLQVNGVPERKALDEWVQEAGADRKLVNELPGLERGEGYVWSPGWLRTFKRVRFARKSTFDASATPEVGKESKAAKLAEVDVAALRSSLAEVVEQAEKEDPKALRRRVAELERDLAKASRNIPENIPSKVERVEVPVLKDAQILRLEQVAEKLRLDAETALERIGKTAETARAIAREVLDGLDRAKPIPGVRRPPAHAMQRAAAVGAPPARRPLAAPNARAAATPPAPGEVSVGNSGLRRMLIALAQRPQGLTNQQLGVRAGVSSRSGTFSTYLGRARSQGWIDGRGTVRITDAGLAALGHYDPLPEGAELAAYWIAELGGGAARMLRALVDAYPNALTNEQLGQAAQISHVSGTFSTYLGRLRALELVTGRGELRASEELAP
jgi:uncharacterized protein